MIDKFKCYAFFPILSKIGYTYFAQFVFSFLVFHLGYGTLQNRHNQNVAGE